MADIPAGQGGGDPDIQCFVFGGGPVQQVKDRADESSAVFGINTEQQVLWNQVEHTTGDSLGSQ